MSDYITTRDKTSYQILENFGLAKNSHYFPGFDLATLLEPPQNRHDDFSKTNIDLTILGICITSVFEIYYGDRAKDLIIIDELAKALNSNLSKMPSLHVHLFVFKEGYKDSDVQITESLRKRLKPAERVMILPYHPDPGETLVKVAQCSLFIGTKYHSCVFAYISQIPLLVINYHPKCSAFAKEVGLSESAIISLQDIIDGKFAQYLDNLLNHPDKFHAELPVNLARQKTYNSLHFVTKDI